MQKKLAIIGAGIAGLLTAREILESDLVDECVLFDAGDFAPGCSLGSTAVINRSGIQRGLSPLGDLLVDSYFLAVNFFKEKNYPEVEFVPHLHLATEAKRHSLFKRFSYQGVGKLHAPFNELFIDSGPVFEDETLLIKPDIFLARLMQELKANPKFRFQKAVIEKVTPTAEITLATGELQSFSRVILCLGGARVAWREHFFKDFDRRNLRVTQEVTGFAISYIGVELGNSSFCFSLDQKNLIYRSLEKEVWLGGTSQKRGELCPDWKQLKEQEEVFLNFLHPKHREKFASAKKTVRGGLREKGQARQPWMAPLSDQVFEIHGLYKNGYTLAFSGALKALEWLKA